MAGVAVLFGGAEGNRTPDLSSAIAALSQLSYGPVPCGDGAVMETVSGAVKRGPSRAEAPRPRKNAGNKAQGSGMVARFGREPGSPRGAWTKQSEKAPMDLNRRQFLKGVLAAGLALSAPRLALGAGATGPLRLGECYGKIVRKN